MGEYQRTLRELTALDFTQEPLAITYPNLDNNFELKGYMIHALPKFHGMPSEDPHLHLKKLHMVCSSIPPNKVDVDNVKLRAFPFSLKGAVENWFFNLPNGVVKNWIEMKRFFLEKYFPASREIAIRKDIFGICQTNESLYEYWERFRLLVASCPNHHIEEHLLIQYFYDGLVPADRCIIDAASGGTFMNKTLDDARTLIEDMAFNLQQFEYKGNTINRDLHEVSHVDNVVLTQTLQELTRLMKQIMPYQSTTPEAPSFCDICTFNHYPDTCLVPQDELKEGVATSEFLDMPKYQQFGNTYNSNQRNHPNLRLGKISQQGSPQQKYQMPQQRQQAPLASSSSESTMMEMIKMMMEQMHEIRKENTQLKEEIERLKNNQNQHASVALPSSQTVPTPKSNNVIEY